ncbi:Rpn family recombination-promoting nuclease/putative transposase [Lysinibacillus sp. CD3-6]|uniref:Rpn family recombination-promoting nuclease/putative transposase n=1 Tax=Lysinibacillus sp. CD3-6 TaxID=2892541 RepID=UPI001172D137|nr:Rpn family recombination-promoting nuclease/putative transposase [Lysinibacillus sp. CD3-6]UED82145.1 Rpn family recombination-promoting nuclease/putative transposase [Lysinibacillus sp. CD3-6]
MKYQVLSRIPLKNLMDLKIDFAFKHLFGSERNKQLTIVFLNAILNWTGSNKIKEITFINHEVGGEYKEDKQSRLDIVVKTEKEDIINIEIQLANKNDMFKRTLFYWSRLYNLQLQKGKGYYTLNPTITINICDFTLFKDIAHYHSTYHLYEDKTLQRVQKSDDVLEIHFIEMNKFLKAWLMEELNPIEDIIVKWLLLLVMVDGRKQKVYEDIYKVLEELAMKDRNLREAFEAWEELSQDPESIIAYESRVKFMIDEVATLEDAKYHAEQVGIEKGIQEGMQKGIQEGIQEGIKAIARKMIVKGNSNEEIMELTSLTFEEIQVLRQDVER